MAKNQHENALSRNPIYKVPMRISSASELDKWRKTGIYGITSLEPVNGSYKFLLELFPISNEANLLMRQTTYDLPTNGVFTRTLNDNGVYGAWGAQSGGGSNKSRSDEYIEAVEAGGGVYADKSFLDEIYSFNSDLLDYTEYLFVPHAGYKLDETGDFITTLYNMVKGGNAVVNPDLNSYPYFLPSFCKEQKVAVYNPEFSDIIGMTFNPFEKSNEEEWSIIICFQANNKDFQLMGGESYLVERGNNFIFGRDNVDEYQNTQLCSADFSYRGKINTAILTCDGKGNIFFRTARNSYSKSGLSKTSLKISSLLDENQIFFGSDVSISYFQLVSKFMSEDDIIAFDKWLYKTFDQYVTVGSKLIKPRPSDRVAYNGIPIAHSISDAEWANAYTLYDNSINNGDSEYTACLNAAMWCWPNNNKAKGVKYGRIKNYYACQVEKFVPFYDAHMLNKSEFTQIVSDLDSTTAGLKMKNPIDIFNNEFANNASGMSLCPGGGRTQSGIFQKYNEEAYIMFGMGETGFGEMVFLKANTTDVITFNFAPIGVGGVSLICKNENSSNELIFKSPVTSRDVSALPIDIRIPSGHIVKSATVICDGMISTLAFSLLNYDKTTINSLKTLAGPIGEGLHSIQFVEYDNVGLAKMYMDKYVRFTCTKVDYPDTNIVIIISTIKAL